MSLIDDTYIAFMMDHAAGQHSAPMAVAADLHVLLSDKGAEVNDTWRLAASEILDAGGRENAAGRLDLACGMIANGYDHIKWRRGIFGPHYSKSPVVGGKYMRLLPGKAVPTHGHAKLEVTVVLEGQLSDGSGEVYAKGDIVFGVPGERHKPAAYGDVPCICFVAKA